MIPDVGSTALFTFKQRFETLNGVYRIRAETTFRDAIGAGVDFVDPLYAVVGLQETDFNADYTSYLNDRVVVLESVKDADTVYYVPESVFLTVPDPTIKEYYDLIAVVGLGVFANTQEILPLLDQMTDLIKASVGVENPLRIMTNPGNKMYLTDTAYAQLEQKRKENITKLMPLSIQLLRAQDEIVDLRARLAAYEDKITGSA